MHYSQWKVEHYPSIRKEPEYEKLLTEQTRTDPVWAYSKKKIANAYLTSRIVNAVKTIMKLVDW